ncbi:hypothetical protein ES702_04880 [subsurface metagenome]
MPSTKTPPQDRMREVSISLNLLRLLIDHPRPRSPLLPLAPLFRWQPPHQWRQNLLPEILVVFWPTPWLLQELLSEDLWHLNSHSKERSRRHGSLTIPQFRVTATVLRKIATVSSQSSTGHHSAHHSQWYNNLLHRQEVPSARLCKSHITIPVIHYL